MTSLCHKHVQHLSLAINTIKLSSIEDRDDQTDRAKVGVTVRTLGRTDGQTDGRQLITS